MKKLILTMVFVFATGTTFMNANTFKEYSPECYEIAEFMVEAANYEATAPDFFGWPGEPLSYSEAYELFASEYDKCESNDPYLDEFQFPPYYY